MQALNGSPLRAAIIYHMWPHYRRPVMEALDRSAYVEWTFFGSGEDHNGVRHVDTASVRHFVEARHFLLGSIVWQWKGITVALSGNYDAVVYLADAHFITNWIAAPLARMRGKAVLFWGHGWRRREHGLKRRFRMTFYRLAHRLLVYAERGRDLGVVAGFPADRISVVYNSLDALRADQIVAQIEDGKLNAVRPQALFIEADRPLLICSARLTQACRFDLLLSATAKLSSRGRPVNVLLIGEGPERAALAARAEVLGVDLHLYGDCYDEGVIGQLIYHADLTVSPGKIGLTAVHSLMYGTPAITHDNLDEQMPEVEAIEPGVTGLLFRQGDADDLADTIVRWLDNSTDRVAVRRAARRIIAEKWNPIRQAAILEHAVLEEGSAASR